MPDTPERNSIRLDRVEKDIDELRGDMKGKVGEADFARLEKKMEDTVTRSQFDGRTGEIISKIDDTREDLEDDIHNLEKNLMDKVSLRDFQPVKVVFGTMITIFAGVILTQIARWVFAGG